MAKKEITLKVPEKVKILAINFSPRKDGVTSEMIKECLSWAESFGYVESEIINAADYPSYPCEGTACLKCWGFRAPADATKPQCYEHPDDGVNVIMPKSLEADGLLVGFPIHNGGIASRLRIFQEKDMQISSPMAFTKWAGARRHTALAVICQGMGFFTGQEFAYDQAARWGDIFMVAAQPTADAPAPQSSGHGGKFSTIDGMPVFDKYSYRKEATVSVPPVFGSKNQRTLKNVGRWLAAGAMFMRLSREAFKASEHYAPTMQPYTEYHIKPEPGSYVEKLMKEGKVKYVSEKELRDSMEATI
ncbi:MAG: flavodoxin family protein [Chloroflexi bacterium]|nr:flavodoxin family protein [Chloroflexota bacterium]MBI4267555.1 flavodoxin family protein [Chloroflexota bacterium]